jgi:hypothetical protein
LAGSFDKSSVITTSGGSVTVNTSNRTTVNGQTRNGQSNISISAYTVSASTDPKITVATGVAHTNNYARVNGLSFTEYGAWTIDQSTASAAPTYVGVYGGGAPGVAVSTTVPTTGSATYVGGAAGYVSQANNTNTVGTLATFYGTLNLTANFANGAINGDIRGINAYGTGFSNSTLIGTINDVSLVGNLTGSSFTGAASALATVGTGFDISGATGGFSGAFYGTNAVEAAGSFALTGGTNNVSVIGGFGASSAAPCDGRLKTDFRPFLSRADGLKLYSWRYLGSQRRHIGPIAQDMLQDARLANHVQKDSNGFYWVDFAGLDFVPSNFAAMRAEGERAIVLAVH